MSKEDPFKEQKSSNFFNVRQVGILLGPSGAGKTEFVHAVTDLKREGERRLARLLSNPEDEKFRKAELRAHHSTSKTTQRDLPLSPKIKLFKSSLVFKDGRGLEESQFDRIEAFVSKHVKPRPKKWKDGVMAVIVFDVRDILSDVHEKKRDVAATYRDLLEIWDRDVVWEEPEEDKVSLEDVTRGKKPRRKKPAFRPPLGVVFIGSHLDLAVAGGASGCKDCIDEFVKGLETDARRFLPMSPSMKLPPSSLVLADLKNLAGRLQFAKDFYKARVEQTELMLEGPA